MIKSKTKPNNWKSVELNSVIDLKYGKGLSAKERVGGDYFVYGSNGIVGSHNSFLVKAPAMIIGRKGSVGKVHYSNKPCWPIDTAFYVDLRNENLDFRYLYFFLDELGKKLVFPKGVKPGINRIQYLNNKISLPFKNGQPDLEEQRRIANKIDNLFVDIDKAIEKTTESLDNAKKLLRSELRQVFEGNNTWKAEKLKEVCEFFNGKAHEKDISENGKYIVVNSKFISLNGSKIKMSDKAFFPLKKNDLVMVMSDVPNGKALAKCFIIDRDDAYTLNQRICALRSEKFDVKFLYYQLNRNKFYLSFDTGQKQTNLRKDDVLECPLFIPKILDQKKIAERLDKISDLAKKLEKKLNLDLDELNKLKQSILQQAFAGKI